MTVRVAPEPVQIGGRTGARMARTYRASTMIGGRTLDGEKWIVANGDHFISVSIGMRSNERETVRRDAAAILASITFLPAATP